MPLRGILLQLRVKMYNYESYLKTQDKLTSTALNHGMAYLAKLPLLKKANGLISPSLTIKDWTTREDFRTIKGIISAFRTNSRMQLFTGKQTTEPYKRFNKLVPLVLSAFKEYNGIGYASWDWTDEYMQYLLDDDFQKLVPYILREEDLPDFTQAELLDMVSRLDVNKYTITKNECPQLYGFPILLKHMILQTWVCQPQNRHPLMLLDVTKLDTAPASIYGDLEVFKVAVENPDPFRVEQVNVPSKKTKPVEPESDNARLDRELWGDL